jgi:hypothetical protein
MCVQTISDCHPSSALVSCSVYLWVTSNTVEYVGGRPVPTRLVFIYGGNLQTYAITSADAGFFSPLLAFGINFSSSKPNYMKAYSGVVLLRIVAKSAFHRGVSRPSDSKVLCSVGAHDFNLCKLLVILVLLLW